MRRCAKFYVLGGIHAPVEMRYVGAAVELSGEVPHCRLTKDVVRERFVLGGSFEPVVAVWNGSETRINSPDPREWMADHRYVDGAARE